MHLHFYLTYLRVYVILIALVANTVFGRFLATFSRNFSRQFPGSCEERAVLSGNSGGLGIIRDELGRTRGSS